VYAAAWIATYVTILALWALVIVRRPAPTLWKGSSLAALNTAFVVVPLLVLAARRERPSAALLIFDVVLVLLALALGRKWLLLGIDQPESAAVLERCLSQARATFSRNEGSHAVRCGDREITVVLRQRKGAIVAVRFHGCAGSRKAELIRGLFVKQFHPSVPTPRFRA
jgi:hypothetical protein